ncbi:MAG TPA: hypothetical protein VHD83_27080 [Puia sp.]|nr:hypothetical protein [Puia sp.]
MRNLLLLLAAATTAAITTASCSRTNPIIVDNGRIERITIPLSDPGITPAQIRTADSLLDANHIRHDNLRYYRYFEGSIPGEHDVYITADQYANGLRIFDLQKVYNFRNGVLIFGDTTMTQGTTLDTVPSMSLSRLRSLYSTGLHKTRHLYRVSFTDSAYKAEFGYMDTTPFGPRETLVKAWRVSIKHTGMPNNYPYDLPNGYFNDNTEEPIPDFSKTVVYD